MMRVFRLSLALLTASIAGLAGQGSSNARFQFEKTADAGITGPQRLDIDADLLIGARPFTVNRSGGRAIAMNGLGDLRLFMNGAELPYLLIPPSAGEPVFITPRVLPIPSVDTRENKSSGFELDLVSASPSDNIPVGWSYVDALDLDAIEAPFLKRFRLEGSGDRVRWTQLIADGTAFDLPAEGIRHTRIEFPAGDYRYLRVVWDDTNSARVRMPGVVRVRQVTQSSPGPMLRAPVAITRRSSEPGRSRFRLTLPAPRMPIAALELSVGGGNLLRDARVFEASLAGQEARPRLLGQAKLRRVMRDAATADALTIPVAQPFEPQLELVVDDGDNPQLELTAVTAVFAEMPWIYFETSSPGTIVARFGDSRLAPPRYDLEAARPMVGSVTTRASWRPQPTVTLAAVEEGLPMPETGSAMSTEGFEFSRDIPAGAAGLVALQMDIAAMAHSGRDPRRLRDIRVLDRSGMQIPYLLEARDEPLITEVDIELKALPDGLDPRSPTVSSYQVHIPFENLPRPRLVLTTKARVFQRTVTLGTVSPKTERQPARFVQRGTATWTHADQDVAAAPITFDLPDSALDEDLYLLIDEGDNQPLAIDKATLLVPQYAVRLFRRDNQALRLLYGRDDLGAPRYDLALLSGQVLGRAAEEVTLGPEEALSGAATATGLELVPQPVFWSVLAVTVIVLLGLVVRLMRKEAL